MQLISCWHAGLFVGLGLKHSATGISSACSVEVLILNIDEAGALVCSASSIGVLRNLQSAHTRQDTCGIWMLCSHTSYRQNTSLNPSIRFCKLADTWPTKHGSKTWRSRYWVLLPGYWGGLEGVKSQVPGLGLASPRCNLTSCQRLWERRGKSGALGEKERMLLSILPAMAVRWRRTEAAGCRSIH